MHTTTVTIGGRDVEVPHREIPQLIATLVDIQQLLLVKGDVSGESTEDFMSHDDAKLILSDYYYSDKDLRYHAGRVWGAMCRMTRHGELHFDTRCSECRSPITKDGKKNGRTCTHGISTSVGYRLILISRSSIRNNYVSMQHSFYRTIGPTVKNDYGLITGSLYPEM